MPDLSFIVTAPTPQASFERPSAAALLQHPLVTGRNDFDAPFLAATPRPATPLLSAPSKASAPSGSGSSAYDGPAGRLAASLATSRPQVRHGVQRSYGKNTLTYFRARYPHKCPPHNFILFGPNPVTWSCLVASPYDTQ